MLADTTPLWTMIFTGAAAVGALVYAGLTLWLLLTTQRSTRASVLVQLVANNRYLVEYASRDAELLVVLTGKVQGTLTPQQYGFVSLIASQVMCCFECNKLGALSKELFEGIKIAFGPMLNCPPVRNAVQDICKAHPSLLKEINNWIQQIEGAQQKAKEIAKE